MPSTMSLRTSSSDRSKTASTSARLMIPTSCPSELTTGSRLTRMKCIIRAACSTGSSGVAVTGGRVIRSSAVRPSALRRSLWCTSSATGPGSDSASLASRSASETTPSTRPASSTTGSALTRYRRSTAAISLKVVSRLTATTSVVITSLTVAFMSSSLSVHREVGHHVVPAAGALGGRVVEAVADRHHALDVPDAPDDVVAGLVGLRTAGQRHDAVLHGHLEGRWVRQEPAEDHLVGDLLVDVMVRPVEDGEHVGPADDADQAPVLVGDREPLDPAVVHELRRVLGRVVGADRHDGGRHQVARDDPARLGLVPAVQDATENAGLVDQGLLVQHVGLGDEADHLPVVVDHGERANPVLVQGGGHLPERGVLLDPDHPGRHDLLDRCLHLSFTPSGEDDLERAGVGGAGE